MTLGGEGGVVLLFCLGRGGEDCGFALSAGCFGGGVVACACRFSGTLGLGLVTVVGWLTALALDKGWRREAGWAGIGCCCCCWR